jgi:uncharacterized protein (TIGR02001 family)
MRYSPAVPAGLLLASAGCALAKPDIGVEVDHVSRYVARGAVLFDGPALQPSFIVMSTQEAGAWSGGIWSTIDENDDGGNAWDFTEVDYHVEYERNFGPWKTTLGVLRYDYPHTGFAASGEVHVAAGYENELATPTLHLWYDYDQADGSYVNLEVARDVELSERWSLSLSASLGRMSRGQGDYYFGVAEDGFSDLTTTAAVSFSPNAILGFALTLGWASVLDEDYREAVSRGDAGWVMLGAQAGF